VQFLLQFVLVNHGYATNILPLTRVGGQSSS